ncbi:hypothetical protein [Streptomyces sp. NBC_01506]|uniref:hypothetical protein n=1 Tax=Streptomyces sp. NBC_01506 TaxID=2903887 RepID=UPI00386BF35C
MSTRDDLLDTYGRAQTAPLGTWTDLHQALAAIRAENLTAAADFLAEIGTPIYGKHSEHERGLMYGAERLRRMAEDTTEKTTPHGAAVTPSVVYRRAEAFVPRTERSYWVAIADALNAAHTAGMPVGVDLDGTLTDRRGWSVVWDAGRWTVAGYEDGDTPAQAPVTPLVVYRAGYQGDAIPLGWYTTPEAARAHCEAAVSSEYAAHVTLVHDWIGDDSEPLDPWELVAAIDGGDELPTGYAVTPLEVATAYGPDAEQ